MNDFNQMFIMAKYQFRNYIRAKRLYILLIITSIVITLIIAVNAYFGNPANETVKDTAKSFAGFSGTLIVLIALFFGGDAIASEYQNKTGYFLFPNPIKRWGIFWGKFLASFLASAIILFLYYVSGLIYTYYYHQAIPVEYLYSMAYSFIFMLSLLSLTFLFSTFFKNGAVALTIVAILYFFVFNIIDAVSQIAGVEPWFSITYAASIITLAFTNNYPHSTQYVRNTMTLTIYHPYVWEALVIMIVYFIFSGIVAMWIFNHKELK